jgi:hypothetical protein
LASVVVLGSITTTTALLGCATSQESGSGWAVTHPEIRQELLEWRAKDQAGRRRLVAFMRQAPAGETASPEMVEQRRELALEVMEIDREATAYLKGVVDELGWPTRTMVGVDGASAAWILAQHADRDPEFQARALELMRPLVAAGEAAPNEFALLTDRVLLARGEKQIYGTQFAPDENGVRRPRPVEAPEGLNERRRSMGLDSIERYARSLGRSYGQPTDPTPLEVDPVRRDTDG